MLAEGRDTVCLGHFRHFSYARQGKTHFEGVQCVRQNCFMFNSFSMNDSSELLKGCGMENQAQAGKVDRSGAE